ncbi:hypothetical protein K461DRAFT_275055 [Myriangium duriaei CBS 260.36]|uniref:Uncharacterized protein n=1 Tax=Myriangium duriaei CBS 260.36 TaxID=1168546 RepID=A0A9P4J766_9PEZI|nr:hypothetical protein K461DRAFT_275055 [Myriangium duriaei CBS 260.36]
MDSPSSSPRSSRSRYDKRISRERMLRRVKAKRSLATFRPCESPSTPDEYVLPRKSKFVEDQSVGGTAHTPGTSMDDDGSTAPSKLSRFVNSINPLNAFRAFTKTYKDVKEDLTLKNIKVHRDIDDRSSTKVNSTSNLGDTLTSTFGATLERGRKLSASVRGRSLSNLRKARSEINLLPRGRVSTPSLSPTKRYSSESVRRSSSRGLKQQRRLNKRISDLEAQLDKARRELQEALNPASPASELSSHYERYTPKFKIHSARKIPFTPGLLPTLPSESLLYPEMADHQSHDAAQAVTPDDPSFISLNSLAHAPGLNRIVTLSAMADNSVGSDDEMRDTEDIQLAGSSVMNITINDRHESSAQTPGNAVYMHDDTLTASTEGQGLGINLKPSQLDMELTTERVDSQQDIRVPQPEPDRANVDTEPQSGQGAQPEKATESLLPTNEPRETWEEANESAAIQSLPTQSLPEDGSDYDQWVKDNSKTAKTRPKRKTTRSTKSKKRKSSGDDNGEYKPDADEGSSDDVPDPKKRRKSTGSAAKKRTSTTKSTKPDDRPAEAAAVEPTRPRRSTDTQRGGLEVIEEEEDSNVPSSSPALRDQTKHKKGRPSMEEIISIPLNDDESPVGMGTPPADDEVRTTPSARGKGRHGWDWPDFVF